MPGAVDTWRRIFLRAGMFQSQRMGQNNKLAMGYAFLSLTKVRSSGSRSMVVVAGKNSGEDRKEKHVTGGG